MNDWDSLALAYATEYARKQRTGRGGKRKNAKKAGWGLLFWFFGIGF
jgi:hypothetical protein